MSARRQMVQREHSLPVTRRCELLEVARSTAYYRPSPVSEADLALMRLIDEIHLERPFYGSRRMRDELETRGHWVNRKRVQRLMRQMGLAALYPKPRTSVAGRGHKVYPVLAQGHFGRAGEPGLGNGHRLYPDGPGVHVSGRGDGWVLAAGALVAGIEHVGQCVLCRGT